MQTVAVIAGETLSKVPDSNQFSFVQGGRDRVVSSTTDGNGTWQIVTSGSASEELALRVTALPGFRATIDGKPLELGSYDSVMMEVRVPPGKHTIVLQYFPHRFELGVAVALIALVVLGGLGVFGSLFRRRSTKRVPAAESNSAPV